MAGIAIQTDDLVAPGLQHVGSAISRSDVRRVMGRSIIGTIKDHFFKLDAERPNELGGRRTHFYAQAARGVQQPNLTGDGLVVGVNNVGIAQRYFGGEIEAKASKWLTIPARSEAHGKRAREFNNLEFVYFRPDLAALVERLATTVRRTKSGLYRAVGETGGGVMYWLKKRVFQQEDKSVLPTANEMVTPALKQASAYLQREFERGGSR